jgi:fibronectin type 3 domain-containing protein
VVGYFVYRGTISGGPYERLERNPSGPPTFADMTVEAGQTYYYVVTSTTADHLESAYSKEVFATIPKP